MTAGLKLLILSSLSPLAALAVHIVLSRAFSSIRPLASRQIISSLSILLGNMPVVALFWLWAIKDTPGPAAPALIYCLIVYNALGYSYFHLFNMSETARRIRLLYEIKSAGTLKEDEVSRLYGTDDVFGVRVERLLAAGQIREEGGRYLLRGRLLYSASRLLFLWGRLIGSPMIKSVSDKK